MTRSPLWLGLALTASLLAATRTDAAPPVVPAAASSAAPPSAQLTPSMPAVASTSEPRPTPSADSNETEFRHFPGRRYLTLRPVSVYASPDRGARVLADIGRWHAIYAEPVETGWLAIHGAGVSRYPSRSEDAGFLDMVGGQLVLARLLDTDTYESLVGYVRANDLADLDVKQGPPSSSLGLRPMPPLWGEFGIVDPRATSTLTGHAPFDALAIMHVPDGQCTAFFVAPDLLATAGHCVRADGPSAVPVSRVSVRIERGPGEVDDVVGHVVDSALWGELLGHGEDWALIRIERLPHVRVTPLRLHRGDAFAHAAVVPVLEIGYPADAHAITRKLVGFDAPVVSRCLAQLAESWTETRPDRMAINVHLPCIVHPGNSGGPLLVWSAERGRWEVVGIASTLHRRDPITPPFSLVAAQTLRQHAMTLARRYNVEVPRDLGLFGTTKDDTPGAAPLLTMIPRFGAGEPYGTFLLSAGLGRAIGRASGHTPKMPFGVLASADSAVKQPSVGHPALDIPAVISMARDLCVRRCGRDDLTGPQPEISVGGFMPETLKTGRTARLGIFHVRTGLDAVIAAGDLFVFESSTGRVRGIARDVMGLVEAGADADWDRASPCRCEALPARFTPAAAVGAAPRGDPGRHPMGLTPGVLPGGMVLTPRDAAALLAGQSPPVVMSSFAGALGVPGAADAGTKARSDAATAPSDDTPVLVIGLDRRDWDGYARAIGAVRSGRVTYWVREGLAGWAHAGLPLTLAGGMDGRGQSH